MRIEVPDPIIDVEIDTEVIDRDKWESTYSVSIVVGGVRVFSRAYHDRYDEYDSRYYVEDANEARDKCAAEFGAKLRELLNTDS